MYVEITVVNTEWNGFSGVFICSSGGRYPCILYFILGNPQQVTVVFKAAGEHLHNTPKKDSFLIFEEMYVLMWQAPKPACKV